MKTETFYFLKLVCETCGSNFIKGQYRVDGLYCCRGCGSVGEFIVLKKFKRTLKYYWFWPVIVEEVEVPLDFQEKAKN